MSPMQNDSPGRNVHFSLPGFTVRRVEPVDFAAIEELVKPSQFQIGIHNLQLYYSISPEAFNVAVEDRTGDIVAFDSYVKVPGVQPPVYMGFLLLVRKDKLGIGLTKLFATMNYAHFAGMGNSTADSIQRYSLGPMDRKLKGFAGALGSIPTFCRNAILQPGGRIAEVNNADTVLKSIAAYDTSIHGTSRVDFLLAYMLDRAHSHSIVAFDANNDVIGYATVRMYCDDPIDRYYAIQPLYANDENIAMCLMKEALLWPPSGSYVYFLTSATNRLMLHFAHATGMRNCSQEMRSYSETAQQLIAPKLNWSKAHAIYEIFPI